MLKRLRDQGTNLPDDADEMTNYDLAIWVYLEHFDVFSRGIDEYQLWDSSGWYDSYIENANGNDFRNKQTELTEAIKDYLFETKSWKRLCTVRVYNSPESISYVAFPQGQPAMVLGYGKKAQLNNPQLVQSVGRVYFTYKPKLSQLSVKSVGGNSVKKRYAQLFVEHVLKKDPEEMTEKVFDLNQFKDFDKEYRWDAEVESFRVKSVTLLRYGKTEKIDVEDLNNTHTGIGGIKDSLERLGNPQRFANVIRAKVYMRFKEAPKGMRRTVTVQLRYPNGHNFADKPLHNKLREYLVRWGIATKHTDEIATQYSKSES